MTSNSKHKADRKRRKTKHQFSKVEIIEKRHFLSYRHRQRTIGEIYLAVVKATLWCWIQCRHCRVVIISSTLLAEEISQKFSFLAQMFFWGFVKLFRTTILNHTSARLLLEKIQILDICLVNVSHWMLPLSCRRSLSYRNQSIDWASQWTSFCLIGTSVMKKLLMEVRRRQRNFLLYGPDRI